MKVYFDSKITDSNNKSKDCSKKFKAITEKHPFTGEPYSSDEQRKFISCKEKGKNSNKSLEIDNYDAFKIFQFLEVFKIEKNKILYFEFVYKIKKELILILYYLYNIKIKLYEKYNNLITETFNIEENAKSKNNKPKNNKSVNNKSVNNKPENKPKKKPKILTKFNKTLQNLETKIQTLKNTKGVGADLEILEIENKIKNLIIKRYNKNSNLNNELPVINNVKTSEQQTNLNEIEEEPQIEEELEEINELEEANESEEYTDSEEDNEEEDNDSEDEDDEEEEESIN